MRKSTLRTLGLLAVATLGCASGHNFLARGPRFAGTGATLPAQDTLRIVSFNVQFARHIEHAIDLLRYEPELHGADIIALQEMDEGGTRRIARALDMHYVYYPAVVHPRHGRHFGNAILARWPIEEDRKLILPHLARFRNTQRIAVTGTIRPAGRPIRIYSTHLETIFEMGPAKRREQAAAIIADAAAADGPVIVAGDMNSHGVGRVFLASGYAWPTEHAGPTAGFFGWDHVFLRGLRVVGSDGIGVIEDPRGASDHRPVWVLAVVESAALVAGDSVPQLER